jgi:polyhydroxybutyrate depolymerase
MFRACAAALAGLLVLAACSSGDGDTPSTGSPGVTSSVTAGPEGCTPARPASAGDTTRALASGGLDRSYILHVPPAYDGETPAPLVVALHGFASDAASLAAYAQLPAAADANDFVLALPEAASLPERWNSGGPVTGDTDDVAFLTAVLDEIDAELCIDSGAVFVVGYSNGGGMAQRLACGDPTRFSAIGVVGGAYVECPPDVPVIAFHGTLDPIVPYEGGTSVLGGTPVQFYNVRRALSEWAGALGCDRLPVISRPADTVELSTFPRCRAGDGEALLYAVIGGGHTWPGAEDAPFLGMTTHAIDATDLMWVFFSSHMR